jgi:hypothetical protein
MSIEVYLIQPEPDGSVRYPFWDENGDLPDAPEHLCLASLKHCAPLLYGYAFGPCGDPIAPQQIVLGIDQLLDDKRRELEALHPGFVILFEQSRGDRVGTLDVLEAVANGEDWVGDTDATKHAERFCNGSWWTVWHLCREMSRAAERGWYACWSY